MYQLSLDAEPELTQSTGLGLALEVSSQESGSSHSTGAPTLISPGSVGPEACFQTKHKDEIQQRWLASHRSQAHIRGTIVSTSNGKPHSS